jgi:hypothetical protein
MPNIHFQFADVLDRARKIKCGEEGPSCARCVRLGWKCWADIVNPVQKKKKPIESK